jgi:hypothetical protein
MISFAIAGRQPLRIVTLFILKYNHILYILVKKKLLSLWFYNIITSTDGDDMGIHYDYKSTRADKKMRKQQEREQRRLAKKRAPKTDPNKPELTVPEDVVLTMDMITDPNLKK